MTAADHDMVGAVGFAAWLSGGALDVRFKSEGVIEAARRAFLSYPATAKGEVIVAEVDGGIVGWIAREEHPDNISDLWVAPAFQGRGIGSRLLQHVVGSMSLAAWSWKASQHKRSTRSQATHQQSAFTRNTASKSYGKATSLTLRSRSV